MIPNKLGERTIPEDAAALRTLLVMDHVKARSNAGQNIPNALSTIVIFEDEEWDTNAEYVAVTGVFTAKRAGYLSVKAALLMATTTTWAPTEILELSVFVNGVGVDSLEWVADQTAANHYVHAGGSTTLNLAIGDTVMIRVYQNSGAALALHTTAAYNYVCFDWLF